MVELSEDMLVDAVRPVVLERAEDYVGRLSAIDVSDSEATAVAHGTSPYQVSLTWRGGRLNGFCTCPAALDGMCKHQAALGLWVLSDGEDTSTDEDDDTASIIAEFLSRQDEASLLGLLRQAMDTFPGVWEMVGRRATMDRALQSGGEALRDHLLSETTSFFRTRGSSGYWEGHRLGERFIDYLESLEEYLDAGLADVVAPSFKKATERIRAIILRSDSSSGSLGTAGDLAMRLYARACSEGTSAPNRLAKWLVKFEQASPGWPNFELQWFALALGDEGLRTLRNQLEKVLAASEEPADFHLLELQLQAAQLSGDIDQAARLLRDQGRYWELFTMLREYDRERVAMQALQLAIDAGRITTVARSGPVMGRSIPLQVAVAALVEDGRGDEVEDVARRVFLREFSVQAYRCLVEYAADPVQARAWARTEALAEATPWTTRSVLLELAIEDEDWDNARELADDGDLHVGSRERLVELFESHGRPRDAAELLTRIVWESLRVADSAKYASVARQLKHIDRLYRESGDATAGPTLIEEIRSAYPNRPSLRAHLDRLD